MPMFTVICAAPFQAETPEEAVKAMLALLTKDRKNLVYVVQDPQTGERWNVNGWQVK